MAAWWRRLRDTQKIASIAWKALLRLTGLIGLIYVGVERENPDPILVIAFMTMAGLPTVLDLDKMVQGKREDDE